MPKSTKILLIITVGLFVLTFFALNKERKKNTISSEESLFAIADSGKADKIVLESANHAPFTLQIKQIWEVNALYPADDRKMNDLLNFIYKVQIKRPVYKESISSVNKEIEAAGLSISIFAEEQLLKKYTISFDSADISCVNALMDGYYIPYTLQVPGYNENTRKLFSADPESWRSKTIFKSRIGSIKRVKVEFTRSLSDGYEIVLNNNKYEVTGLPGADSIRIYSYLQLFEEVKIREYLPATFQPLKDSLSNINPGFIIRLDDKIADRSNVIKIFYAEGQKGKIYAFVGAKEELVLINPGIFEYLLQKRSFFKPENASAVPQ